MKNFTLERSKGFTLIEILIVIVIISIVATVGVLSIKINENKRLETLTHQIQNILTLAEEEALLRPVTLGLTIQSNQFQFYEFVGNAKPNKSPWKKTSTDVLNSIAIPSDVHFSLKIENDDPDAEAKKETPKIIFASSGDVTPFTLLLSKKNASVSYKLTASENGSLTVEPIYEKDE